LETVIFKTIQQPHYLSLALRIAARISPTAASGSFDTQDVARGGGE
jgi:hypothetical protein